MTEQAVDQERHERRRRCLNYVASLALEEDLSPHERATLEQICDDPRPTDEQVAEFIAQCKR